MAWLRRYWQKPKEEITNLYRVTLIGGPFLFVSIEAYNLLMKKLRIRRIKGHIWVDYREKNLKFHSTLAIFLFFVFAFATTIILAILVFV